MQRFYHSTFTYNQSDFMALASEETPLFSSLKQEIFKPENPVFLMLILVPCNNMVL